MNMETGVSPQGKILVVKTSAGPFDSMALDMNSYVFESTIGANGFQVVGYGRIMHFSAPSVEVTAAWFYHLRDLIAECEAYPSDPIFEQALVRHPGELYNYAFLEKKKTGVVFERTLQWAYVKVGVNLVEEGSILSSVNGIHITFSSVFSSQRCMVSPSSP